MKITRGPYLLLLFILLLLQSIKARAQQDALFSQYMFNGLVINPAYAGSSDAMNITASARKQWLGIEGAPTTQTLSAHTPVKNEKIGVGLILINDNIGVTHQYSALGIYSYSIPLKKNKKISFGLQGGVYQFNSKLSSLATRTSNDHAFSSDIRSSIVPSFGTGFYFSSEKYYLGFSIPHLVNNFFKDTSLALNLFQRRHYLMTGGFLIDLSDFVKLKPSILLKAVNGAPLQIDINANVIIKNVVWLGLSYRSNSSVNFLTQLQLTDQLRIGYSYDMGFDYLSKIGRGSHELILNYNLSFIKGKLVTPRYF